MIIDSLQNAEKYFCLHPRFAKAFAWIRTIDLGTIEPGKYPVEGTDIHASVSEKEGVHKTAAKFECHDKYIDIQVCPSGSECLGWKPRELCHDIKERYNEEKDVTFFNDLPGTYFHMHEGEFAIFYPEDVHAPMIGDGMIRKLVIKVRL